MFIHLNSKFKKGFSLLELVLAVSIFSVMAASIGVFAIDTYRAISNAHKRVEAALLLEEINNALIIHKNSVWSSIVQNSSSGPKHLQLANNKYSIADGVENRNGFTLSLEIQDVQRDQNGVIVESGGYVDVKSRAIVSNISWNDMLNKPHNVKSKVYINDWNSYLWKETTQAHFNSGTRTNTVVGSLDDGDIRLDTVIYADWCNPTIALTTANLSGQGVAKTITAIPGKAFIGTGDNASGLSYSNVNITNTDPPVATESGTFNGYKTNSVFGESSYAYLATDNNSEEIVILNISTGTPSKIGYFNAPGNGSGNSIYVTNDKGYMTSGNKFYVFDLTSRSGARSQTGISLTLAGTGKKVIISGNYAYIAVDSSTTQLQIIDITDPANLQIVGSASVNGSNGVDVYINGSSTRAFLATQSSATQREVFIIDLSSNLSSKPTISSYDTNGMSPTAITIAAADRAIVVGTNGEEYQVINILSESNLVRCGGLEVNTGVNGIASVVESDGDAFSYIVTGDSASELKLIKGGPGGGNGQGQGHPPTGSFTSQIFDSTSSAASFNSIEWSIQVPTNTNLSVQIRSGNTIAEIETAQWFGSDGTSSTYFTNPLGNMIPLNVGQGKRYIQYKVYFTSDKLSTPILESINIYYQK